MKLSVIIPTKNEQARLPALLWDLYEGLGQDMIREVLVADGGSSDNTCLIAEEAGCVVVSSAPGRGGQIAAAMEDVRSDWVLILHADMRLAEGWATHLLNMNLDPAALYYGRFDMDDHGFWPTLVTWGVALRCRFGRRPYGDQGFLISKARLQSLGGYPNIPIMDDVALVDLYPRHARQALPFKVCSSARAYQHKGYVRRILGNAMIYWSYRLGTPPEKLMRRYYGQKS